MNKGIRCIIVDDEVKSCEVLKKMLYNYCDGVNVVQVLHNAADAVEAVKEHQPELVFLDIEMPGGDGFHFLQQFATIPFRIIFITAYDQYAIRAIRFSALDYLLKPLSIEQLREALQRFRSMDSATGAHELSKYETLKANISHKRPGFSKLAIPTLQGFEFVDIADIVWMQASDSYTVFHLKSRSSLISSHTLKKYEEMLSDEHPFFRIHHSFMVNLNHINRFVKSKNASVIMSDGKELEVSVRKKEALIDLIQNRD